MKYSVDKKKFEDLEGNIKLPKYQRRLVWSEREKQSFINSLKRGFPFGSILIYQYEDDKKYSLIDGLQRYTTMKDFSENPHKYFDFDEYIKNLLNLIPNLTPASESHYRGKIVEILKEVTKEINSKSNVDPDLLSDKLNNEIPQLNVNDISTYKQLIRIQTTIKDQLMDELDIRKVEIPCVQFTGNESELADVFQNLNTGGKKLTKYQVFAAQWSYYEIELNDDEYNLKLLNKVIDRYENLTETRDVEIEGFNRDKMYEEKKINLSELCYAMGSVIVDSLPVFWPKKDKDEDLANEIGYSVMGIVLSVENNRLHKIIDKKDLLDNSTVIEELTANIVSIFNDINNYFKKYLTLPGTEERYETKVATNFQILSYFASLWSIKFRLDEEERSFYINEKYKSKYEKALQNFITYFIRDAVTYRWSGTGDKKLNEIYMEKQNRYLIDIEKVKLESSILEWLDENLLKPSIRINNISKMLLTVTYSFNTHDFKFKNYDFEHVYPRKTISKYYKEQNIPGGNIGNIMFLAGALNKGKRELNLYEYKLEGMEPDKDFLDLVQYPLEKEMFEAINSLKNGDATKINRSIESRAKSIITSLMNKLY